MVDVQGVIRWLVEAKVPVPQALPLVSSLAKEGVKSPEDFAKLGDDALSRAVKPKPLLTKIRAKIRGSGVKKGKKRAGPDNYPSSDTGRGKKPRGSTDSDMQRAPHPPETELSDAQLAGIEVKINRSPVMVLWAAVVAQRMSFEWSEGLSVGRAVADWLAQRKGEYLGIFSSEGSGSNDGATVEETGGGNVAQRTVEMMGQTFVLHQCDEGWRAVSKGKLTSPKRVHSYLQKAYGADFGPVREAMVRLAAALPLSQVEASLRTMSLYEAFRPDVAKGKAGWGQYGTLRLARVLELRDEISREFGGQENTK